MTDADALRRGFAHEFRPDLSPSEMLELGVFGGAYFDDISIAEYPKEWFEHVNISTTGKDPELNYFGVDASQSRAEWILKGWISKHDPLGWFEWYCRYYVGRRLPVEDERQIKRWRNMVRHVAQVKYACRPGDSTCHTRQRQALLHWAYDARKM